MKWLKQYKFQALIFLVFAGIFAAVSLVNHYNLRTFAYDLGLYNHAIYQYAHFVLNKSTLLEPFFPNRFQLGDHFDLFLIIISPLYYVFGSSTLLIVQIAAILFGGLGIYKFVGLISTNKYLPTLAVIHFFGIWGIYAALSFDYHSNVVAAMFIPWLFIAAYNANKKQLILFTILALICKENTALYLVFILVGLWWLNFSNKKLRLFLPALAGFCLAYFYMVVFKIMPAFAPNDAEYIHFKFDSIGNNFGEALTTVLTKPIYTFSLLFQDVAMQPETFGIKTELHFYFLLSGGFTLLLQPQLLLMTLVLFAQKLFNNDFSKWGIVGQYSIEFAPIICVSFYWYVRKIPFKMQMVLTGLVICSTYFLTVKSFNNTFSKWQITERVDLLSKAHYKNNYNAAKIIPLLKNVPANINVSCASNLAPHLAFRDNIYLFPYYKNTDLIILLDSSDSRYPISIEEYQEKLNTIKNDSNWVNCYRQNNLVVFRQKNLNYSFGN